MNSHVRVNIEANFAALQALHCSAYKVLMYLANRADSIGRCFPARDTIADECNLHWQTVDKALESLESQGYMVYLRQNAYDPILGKKLPNVYMVSPLFLELSESAKESAINLWNDFSKISYINQQQNHVPKNNTSNQHQKQQQQPLKAVTPDAPAQPKIVDSKKTKTAKSEPQKTASAATTTQRSENKSRSSAIVKKFTNPLSITEPLPDGLSELLAERVNSYGIPKPMARGFVHKYGYEHVAKSCTYFEFVRHTQQDIKSPAGFFRSILETGTADETLPVETQLVSRDYSEYDSYLES